MTHQTTSEIVENTLALNEAKKRLRELEHRVANLTEALRIALPALEENADDECAFWGDDHDLAKDAVKIHEAAKSALANESVSHEPKNHE